MLSTLPGNPSSFNWMRSKIYKLLSNFFTDTFGKDLLLLPMESTEIWAQLVIHSKEDKGKKLIFQNRCDDSEVEWWTLKVRNCCVNISGWPFLTSISYVILNSETSHTRVNYQTTTSYIDHRVKFGAKYMLLQKPQPVCKVETTVVSSGGPVQIAEKPHNIEA